MRRRPIIRPKKPVYLGCEGESEVAYGQVLNDHLRHADIPVYLQVDVLAPGAGDPLARVQRAIQRIVEREKRRVRFQLKAIIMDIDQAAHAPQRIQDAGQLATQNGIIIIWQDPCHEALLLRHMPNCATHKPPSSPVALQALRAVWSEYKKPMPRSQLAKRIDLCAIRQAASVEPDLRAFLEEIRLLP